MKRIMTLERVWYSCPEINCGDFERYPLADNKTIAAMNSVYAANRECVSVFPFVRADDSNRPYIELYIWDCKLYAENYVRFIIRDGYRLTEADEQRFLHYTRYEKQLLVDKDIWRIFSGSIRQSCPEWKFADYKASEVGMAAEHIYFASHKSCKEILYKAGLHRIALHLDEIPEYNLIGKTPVDIIEHNVTLKLLKILNQHDELVRRMFDEISLNKTAETYRQYADYIDALPSVGQWLYLEKLYANEGTLWGLGFNRTVYRRLQTEDNAGLFFWYQRYFELVKLFPAKKIRIPKANEVEDAVEKMEMLRQYNRKKEKLDRKIRFRKRWDKKYEYSNGTYAAVLPENFDIFIVNAMAMHNCLIGYLESHANSETTIIYVRKVVTLDRPYVTIEVNDNCIEQAYGIGNSLPERSVYEFLEEFCSKKDISYDPDNLIFDVLEDFDDPMMSDELWDYLADFDRRHGKTGDG